MKPWLRRLLPLLFALTGALLVWAGSLLIPDSYTSTAMVRLEVEPFPAADVINEAYQEVVSRRALKDLIVRLNLYSDERQRLPLEDVIDAAKKDDIRLDILPDHDVRMAFGYRDAKAAQAAADALLRGMIDASAEHSRRNPGWGRLELKSAAGPGTLTSSSLVFWKQPRYVAAGTLVVRKMDSFQPDLARAERRTADLQKQVLSRPNLEHLLSTGGYPFQELCDRQGLPEAVDELSRRLRVKQLAAGNVLQLKFTYPDAKVAQLIVSRLVTDMTDRVRLPENEPSASSVVSAGNSAAFSPFSARIEPDLSDFISPLKAETLPQTPPPQSPVAVWPLPPPIPQNAQPGWEHTLNILDPASLPEEPDGPSRLILSSFGFFLGLGLWAVLNGK